MCLLNYGLISNDVVTVPAGTFEKCVRVETVGSTKKDLGGFMQSVNVEGINWYAPGVGMIKFTRKEKSNMMVSGEMTLQLQSFKK